MDAAAAESELAAPKVAVLTATLAEEPLLALRALVDGLLDERTAGLQLGREAGNQLVRRRLATEPVRALLAGPAALRARTASTERKPRL